MGEMTTLELIVGFVNTECNNRKREWAEVYVTIALYIGNVVIVLKVENGNTNIGLTPEAPAPARNTPSYF